MQESDGFKDENIKEDVNVTLHSGNHVPIEDYVSRCHDYMPENLYYSFVILQL